MRLLLIGLLSVSTLFAAPIILPGNFKADFTQTITNTKKKTINYSGKVRFSDKIFLKWEYLKPTKKEVCTNGLELLVVDHDLEQISSYFINEGFDFAKILEKAKLHSKNIYVAKYKNKNYTIQVNSKQQLQSIAYFDDLDNKVQIIFTKIKYGKGKFNKESMKCHFPKNYDLIGD